MARMDHMSPAWPSAWDDGPWVEVQLGHILLACLVCLFEET
jgi:hypothetical protein